MQPTEHAPSLVDYLGIFKRRWWVILIPVLVVPAIAVGIAEYQASKAEDEYRASHTLIVNPNRQGGVPFSVEQMALVSTTGEVADRARDSLGGHDGYSVSSQGDLDLGTVVITAQGQDPQRAVEIADTYARTFLDELAAQDNTSFQEQVSEARAEVQEASAELDRLSAEIFANPDGAERLEAERNAILNDYQLALSNLSQIESTGAPQTVLRTLDAASPSLVEKGGFSALGNAGQIGLAGLLGLMIGVGLAMVLENLDRTIRDRPDVAEVTSLPVLTEVPVMEKGHHDEVTPPDSAVMEAYRRLRTMIFLAGEERRGNDRAEIVMVVSPNPQAGKTTTVAHLAATMAETKQRVLAVSADFRRPRLQKLLVEDRSREPIEIRDDQGHLAYRIVKTQLENVDLVTADQSTDDPTQLLLLARRMLDRTKGLYDSILIDTAPILAANDALDLVKLADQTIVVVRSREASQGSLLQTLTILDQAQADVTGVAVTGLRTRDAAYGYGYEYRYGAYTATPVEPSGSTNGKRVRREDAPAAQRR